MNCCARKIAWTIPLLMLTLQSGCTVGPDYHRPTVATPSVWAAEPQETGSRTTAAGSVDTLWWESFHDPELSALVSRLVTQNLDLRTAAERIVQGRAQRQVTAAQGLPQISERSTYDHERESPTGFITLTTPAPSAIHEPDTSIRQNGRSAPWELDLFGRVRRAVEVENATLQASVENRHAVALSLLAELAQDYLQLRGTQTEMAIARSNLELADRNTVLVQQQMASGVATMLDLAQSRAQQANIVGTLPTLDGRQSALINAISLLLALPPRSLEAELVLPKALPSIPPIVPIGLPGDLVRRRPDVRQAEAELHAATAETGVAVAAFYPDVSLTGAANLDGRLVVNAFSLPSRAFSVGPAISIPIFQGGQLTGELRLRRSQQRQAAIRFQKAVLQAWQDVDNALTAYHDDQRRRSAVVEVVGEDQIALAASRERYVHGVSDFLNVVSSETLLLQAQNDLATSDTLVATDLVALYRALGGGWEVVEPVESVTHSTLLKAQQVAQVADPSD